MSPEVWLGQVGQLVAQRDTEALADIFCRGAQSLLSLSSVYVVAPAEDGRRLTVVSHPLDLAWQVDDFEHPFSHCLNQAKPMLLDSQHLMYWTGNRDFHQLVDAREKGESVWLAPLPDGDRKVSLILLVIGSAQVVNGLYQDRCWQAYCDVFVQQWRLIKDIGWQQREKQALTASVNRWQRGQEETGCLVEQTGLIGSSEAMKKLRGQVSAAAATSLAVLIQGETGTGKELVARAVHQQSVRRKQAFVAINCAAIPAELLESELFGYEKGAFSGANKSKEGLIAQADGGSLFLDEIGDMPLSLQAKLLRVLETQSYRPVGGKCEIHSDFRLIAATHVNLRRQTQQGKFREDLYYRLYQYPLMIPALVERSDDIAELANYFVARFNHDHHMAVRGLSDVAMQAIVSYEFPGNVRELRHLVEFGCAQTPDGEMVDLDTISARLDQSAAPLPERGGVNISSWGEESIQRINNLKEAVQQFEHDVLKQRLGVFNGDRAKAAESLGLPKRTLAHKCQKLEVMLK